MKPARAYPLLILVAILVAYANSFSGTFVFDDWAWTAGNPHIRHLWPLWNTLQPPQRVTGTGRPVVCLTLALNYAVSGLDPWSYHVANLAIHASAALVLFGIVRRALQGLPSEMRQVIIMKEYEGLKFSEIADVLGIPISTVKTRMYTGLSELRKRLGHLREAV